MSLFRVGDEGVTRGGQPYVVIALRGEKVCFVNPLKPGAENFISANGKGQFREGTDSSRDLMLPDDAFLELIPGVTHTMKRLRECGWNVQLLLSIYPKLKRVDSTLSDRVTQTEKLIPTTRHKGYYMKVAEGHVGRIEIGSMKIFFTGEIHIEEKL